MRPQSKKVPMGVANSEGDLLLMNTDAVHFNDKCNIPRAAQISSKHLQNNAPLQSRCSENVFLGRSKEMNTSAEK